MYPDVASIPQELKSLPQWVCWDANKYPVNPKTGEKAKVNMPETWSSFEQALDRAKQHNLGVGFVFSEDAYVGIDLDKCRNPETGVIENWARTIVDDFDSYTEVSPSGTGIHIIIRGKKPGKYCRNTESKIGVEIYDQKRYFTVTGNVLEGHTVIQERQDQLNDLYASVIEKAGEQQPLRVRKEIPGAEDDEVLLEKIRNAQEGEKFAKIWQGNWEGFYRSWSEADAYLCERLWFWTADRERVRKLWRQSGLWRSKAENRDDYVERTLDLCCTGNTRQLAGLPADIPDSNLAFTDLDNADRLVELHGDDLRWCEALQTWLIWDEYRWKQDDAKQVLRFAREVRKMLTKQMNSCDDDGIKAELKKGVKALGMESRLSAMLSLAKSDPKVAVRTSDFDQHPMLLGVQNGILDISTGKIVEPKRSLMITKCCNVDFDTEAEHPLWSKFLERIMRGDEEMIGFLQRIAGYSMTGDTSEHVFFIFWGNGANGKGTFINTIGTILGDYHRTAMAQSFMSLKYESRSPRDDLADLAGSRLVIAGETERSAPLAESLVKQLTGGDEITARFLYSRSFTFTPEFKIVMPTNHKPTVAGADDGIWRRIRLVPFTVQIPEHERDPRLGEKLKAEASGILNWMLKGCLDWQKNGLDIPAPVREATEEYRGEEDALSQFIAECCVLEVHARCRLSTLHERYVEWTMRNEEKHVGIRAFGKRMKEKGFQQTRSNGIRYWEGIGIAATEEADDELVF